MDPDGNMAWLEGLARKGIVPGLESTLELLRRVGDPHVGMRFVHVAGTDGKGSVCAMIESILKAAGKRVGAFTSPTIMRVNEGIRMGGEEVAVHDAASTSGRCPPRSPWSRSAWAVG